MEPIVSSGVKGNEKKSQLCEFKSIEMKLYEPDVVLRIMQPVSSATKYS